ncbi:MAG: chemotaxis protein CheW [Anaerolineae bacterium]
MTMQGINDEISRELLEQTWARRAEMLAEKVAEVESGEQLSVVLVQLGQEVYGLEAHYVYDARPLERITPVPRAPVWMSGVVNVRGRIYPVLDLARFLGLPTASNGSNAGAYLVVVRSEMLELALKVDHVLSVIALPESRLQETTDTLNIPATIVRGVMQNTDDPDLPAFLVVLDLPQLLSDPQLIIHEELV